MVNNALTSPGFPRKYPNNMHCVYNVSIPPGKALKISFSTFCPGNRNSLWVSNFLTTERFRVTLTVNGKREIQVENISNRKQLKAILMDKTGVRQFI